MSTFRQEVYANGEISVIHEVESLGGGTVEYRRYEAPDLSTPTVQRDATEAEKKRLRAHLRTRERERVQRAAENAIDQLETIAGSSGTPTNDQLANAVRTIAGVLAKLIRFVLRKIDVGM